MKPTHSDIFEPIDDLREFHVTISVREHNGIDSDPKVRQRPPSLSETIQAVEALVARLKQIHTTSTLP